MEGCSLLTVECIQHFLLLTVYRVVQNALLVKFWSTACESVDLIKADRQVSLDRHVGPVSCHGPHLSNRWKASNSGLNATQVATGLVRFLPVLYIHIIWEKGNSQLFPSSSPSDLISSRIWKRNISFQFYASFHHPDSFLDFLLSLWQGMHMQEMAEYLYGKKLRSLIAKEMNDDDEEAMSWIGLFWNMVIIQVLIENSDFDQIP